MKVNIAELDSGESLAARLFHELIDSGSAPGSMDAESSVRARF